MQSIQTQLAAPRARNVFHKFGAEIPADATTEQALSLAGAGFTARREPLVLRNPEWTRAGVDVPAFALVRDDTGAILTVVSPTYEVFQHAESFGIVDDLRARGARIETAGCVDDGRRAWACLSLATHAPDGDEILPGDNVRSFLLVSGGHGGDAVKIAEVQSRTRCSNQIRSQLAGARSGVFTIKHTRNMRGRVELAAEIIASADATRAAWTDQARRMATTRISREAARNLAFSALDVNPDARDGREGAKRREIDWRLGNEINVPGTLWGAVNAVTEFTSHSERAGRSRGADRLLSSVDGTADAINQRAWTSALELVGAN